MSNSEYHQMAKGKWEPSKPKMAANCSGDLAFVPDNEFVELLWENGQIVMQGQNNRNKKVSVSAGFSSNPTSNGEDAVLPIPAKVAKFATAEAAAQDFSSSATATVGLVQDDELVPWLNYPFDYSLEKECCSDLFSELSGINRNSMPAPSNAACSEKTANFGNSQIASAQNGGNLEQGNSYKESVLESDPNAAGRASARVRGGQFFQSSQFQGSSNGVKGKLVDFGGSDVSQSAPCENYTPPPASVVTAQTMKTAPSLVKLSRHTNNASVMNFSHFSRPAVLVKSNLQAVGTGAGLSMVDPFRSTNKASPTETTPIESSVVDSTSGSKQIGGCKKGHNFQGRPPGFLSKTEIKLPAKLPVQEPPRHIPEDALSRENGSICRNRSPDQTVSQSPSFAASTELGRSDSGKAFGPVVASSVGSGSSAGRTTKDSKHGSKRKSTELEESGYRSEDAEEESVDVRKATTSKSTSAKRSRAAEVHNLSERRRRDRINEKMRALQELIPNSNKADKASMLDEAIEYLKTLQLQVQIMSMGSGMCMPPMMVPAGMRHMHAPHMAHFPPVGVGMGMGMSMGMGYGMGMLDMGCSSACPMIPMPQMHGPQLPCSSLSASASLAGMPGSNVPMFGLPGQGLPMAMARGPLSPYSGFSLKVASAPETSATVTTPPGSGPALPSSQKDQLHANSASVHGSSAQQTQTTQGTKGCFSQSAAISTTHQAGSSSGKTVPHTTKTDGVPTNAACCD